MKRKKKQINIDLYNENYSKHLIKKLFSVQPIKLFIVINSSLTKFRFLQFAIKLTSVVNKNQLGKAFKTILKCPTIYTVCAQTLVETII